MLILNRRLNESLVIENYIVVTVLSIRGNQVRLGIEAPRDIVVDRAEVHARKLAEYTAPDAPVAGTGAPVPDAVEAAGVT